VQLTSTQQEILSTLDRILGNLEKVANGSVLRTSPATEALFAGEIKSPFTRQDAKDRDGESKTPRRDPLKDKRA